MQFGAELIKGKFCYIKSDNLFYENALISIHKINILINQSKSQIGKKHPIMLHVYFNIYPMKYTVHCYSFH